MVEVPYNSRKPSPFSYFTREMSLWRTCSTDGSMNCAAGWGDRDSLAMTFIDADEADRSQVLVEALQECRRDIPLELQALNKDYALAQVAPQ